MHGFGNTAKEAAPGRGQGTPVVEAKGVCRNFGEIQAVSEVSFCVERGVIFGLVGSDGAGKTTLLRMIATMIRPTRGRILINGLDAVRDRNRVKELIGYMPQRFGLYQDLTVKENLDFFMDIFGIFGRERERRTNQYLGFSNLLPFQDRQAKDLSGGMRQKLGLACVLVHEPEVLVLDEPTNGVDPVSRREFWGILHEMRRTGMTILISTAYLDEGEKCDRLILMHRSRVLAESSPLEIQAHHKSLEEAMITRIQEVEGFVDGHGFQG